MKKSLRQLLFILLLIVLLVGTSVALYVTGRGHSVFFDNKVLEVGGEKYDPFYRVTVYINGEKLTKLQPKDRGQASCIGQNFSFDLEITEEKDAEPYSKSFTVKIPIDMDGIVYNIPGMLAGLPEEEYASVFVPANLQNQEEDTAEEEVIIMDEFTTGDDL